MAAGAARHHGAACAGPKRKKKNNEIKNEKRKENKDHNILGYEAVTMHTIVTVNYIVNGDPQWLLRQCRAICCKYLRSLSRTYPFMRSEEKMMLVRFCIF